MTGFEHGKIYKIVSDGTDMIYIGSTIETLETRMQGHRSTYNMYLSGKKGFFGACPMFEFGDPKIVLIENFPCNTEEELNRREQYYIDLFKGTVGANNVSNIRAAYTGIDRNLPKADYKKAHAALNREVYKEYNAGYYAANRDTIIQRSADYYKANKEAINQYKSEWGKQKFQCECGSVSRWGDKSKHFKTKKHKDFEASKFL